MNADQTPFRMRLHRLKLVPQRDPDWPAEDDPVLPAVLAVSTDDGWHLMFCPDAVTLLTSLWQTQPYGARGQMLRPVRDHLADGEAGVRFEVVWPAGSRVLAHVSSTRWQQQISRMAGQAADILAAAGERELLGLLAPALAGPVHRRTGNESG